MKKKAERQRQRSTKAEGCTLRLPPPSSCLHHAGGHCHYQPACKAALPCIPTIPPSSEHVVVSYYLNGLSKGHSPRPFASRRPLLADEQACCAPSSLSLPESWLCSIYIYIGWMNSNLSTYYTIYNIYKAHKMLKNLTFGLYTGAFCRILDSMYGIFGHQTAFRG